jgi:formamidopyrimidine-DNA glycosylase
VPELPDITAYNEALERVFGGHALRRVRLASPFVLRTVQPRPAELEGKVLVGTRRIGKRIVLVFPDEYFLVIHLMISGRFKLAKADAPVPGKVGLAAFDWVDAPTLIFTEASSKKRASIHVVRGEADLAALDPGGLEPLGSTLADFAAALRSESRTVKRALTDPHILSGIGNAYSDEILHRAQMSPLKITSKMDDEEMARLHAATEETLREWTARFGAEAARTFPEKVTAFRPEMAVHGKYGEPCPRCGSKVQRIVYAANEANYCATCQTGGKLLADRSMSRLLGKDWPRSLEELEERRASSQAAGAAGPTPAKGLTEPGASHVHPRSRPAAGSPRSRGS